MNISDSKTNSRSLPLCVDLDGTFLKTDMLMESSLLLLKQQPWMVLYFLIWVLRGKAALKNEIARRVDISHLEFPVNEAVLDFVSAEHEQRRTVLVTGSNQQIANAVSAKYPVFHEVYGSDNVVNLTGNAKREHLVDLFGEGGFDYIGNDEPDRVVWTESRHAYYAGTETDSQKFSDIEFDQNFSHQTGGFKSILKMIRLHQWSKNLLVLVPVFLDQKLGIQAEVLNALLGFIAFSCLASGTYVINDLLDLQSDRLNTTKKNRPLASGELSIQTGVVCCAVMFSISLVLCLFLPFYFSMLLVCYLALTLAYSFKLKTLEFLDVSTIAVLHTMRIIGGTLVIGAEHSFWLLAFSLFIFTSFALAKRVSELTNLKKEDRQHAHGRAYFVDDIPLLSSAGMASGYVSVLVVALFINSDKVLVHYSKPEVLWLLCPGFLYWIGRLWLCTTRGEVDEDPIVYVLKDKVSLLTLLCLLLVVAIGFVL